MRLLFVEDDNLLGAGTRVGLQQRAMIVDWVRTRAEAEAALFAEDYDLVLLDIGLPDGSGLDLLGALRDRGQQVPVVLLTALDAPGDKVVALDAGADDYVVKPFDLDELSARIRAVRRRTTGRSSPVIVHGELCLDPAGHTLTRQGEPVHLPPKEFALLQVLMEHPGHAVTRQKLISSLYGWADDADGNPLDVYIHNLRKKLGRSVIQTIRGIGYRIG